MEEIVGLAEDRTFVVFADGECDNLDFLTEKPSAGFWRMVY